MMMDAIKKKFNELYRKDPVIVLLILFLGVASIIFLACAIVSEGKTFFWMFTSNQIFMDHFNSVVYSMYLPYTSSHAVIYPALITIFYGMIGHCTEIFAVDGTGTLAERMQNSMQPMMVLMVIILISIYIIHFIWQKNLKDRTNFVRIEIIFGLLLFSYPFLSALRWGNSILFTIPFIMGFVTFYKSNNKSIQYIAYLMLAIATSIKLYPILFILLIVRDRDYKHFFECLAIVLIVFVIPFAFTDGTPITMVENIIYNMGITAGEGAKISIQDMIYSVGQYFFSTDVCFIIYCVVIAIIAVMLFVTIIYNKSIDSWKILAIIGGFIILGPGISVEYNGLYLLPALIAFIVENKEITPKNLFYVLCFISVFILIPEVGLVAADFIATMRSIILLIMLVTLLYEGVKGAVYNHSDSNHEIER